jgi:hypothetical protein
MTHAFTEDLPNPTVPDLDQRQLDPPMVASVRQVEPWRVQLLPARTGVAISHQLTTDLVKVVTADSKRAHAVLVADVDFLFSHASSATPCWWPARVPMYRDDCAEIYVSVPSGTGRVTVIGAIWAD